MGDKIAIYETLTGNIVQWPNVTDYAWEHGMNDTEGSVTVSTLTTEVYEATTRPWAYSLAVVDANNRVLAAGPIYKRTIRQSDGTIQITAGSFWSLLKKRLWQKSETPVANDEQVITRVTDGSVTTFRQNYTSTLDGLAIGIARGQMRDLPGVTDARFPYPSGTHTRTYDGLEMKMTADIIADLFKLANPATVRWESEFTGTQFLWRAVPLSGVSRQTWGFSLDAQTGVLTEWDITEDAGSQVNQCWQVSKVAKGQNDKQPDASMFARWDKSLAGTKLPRLATVDTSHDNVTQAETLRSYAQAMARSRPYFAFSLTIAKDSVTASGEATAICDAIRPGDWCIITSSDSFYGESTFAGRVEKIGGNVDTLTVSVERVSRYDGIEPGAVPDESVMQMPAGTAAARIKAFGDFTRRANNPVLGGA